MALRRKASSFCLPPSDSENDLQMLFGPGTQEEIELPSDVDEPLM